MSIPQTLFWGLEVLFCCSTQIAAKWGLEKEMDDEENKGDGGWTG